MEDTEMTFEEFKRRAAEGRKRIPAEQRSEIARNAGNATKSKYGVDYYKEINKKSHESKRAKKASQVGILTTEE